MRIFLDANILFSAAKSRGAIRQLLDWLVLAGHECCADGYVIEEARRNLVTKAPQGLSDLDALLRKIQVAPTQPGSAALQLALPLPEKDRPVMAAAIACGCDALVTGDRSHFGRHYGKRIHGVKIHSPRSIAEALL
ncbi:MAG TPA: PIN domain-containing protein [Rhodanobacteraceae bacterium]|nr:PIN domain-containing protein [Rhodanobacteraceae bacterium]